MESKEGPAIPEQRLAELLSMQGYTVRYLYKGGHGDGGVYLASDVDAREAQHIAIDRAQKAKIEKLEKALAKYADHLHGCAYLAFVDDKCTCGHDAMLESFGLMVNCSKEK